jgi:hypothetical protein
VRQLRDLDCGHCGLDHDCLYRVGQKTHGFFQILLSISKTCILFSAHFKNVRSFYYPFQKHVLFLPPISKTCVLFTTHFKNMRSSYCQFKKHAFFLLPISKTRVLFAPLCTRCFIMCSGITKIYDRKTVRHVFTKPVQIEGSTKKLFSQKVVFHRSSHLCC